MDYYVSHHNSAGELEPPRGDIAWHVHAVIPGDEGFFVVWARTGTHERLVSKLHEQGRSIHYLYGYFQRALSPIGNSLLMLKSKADGPIRNELMNAKGLLEEAIRYVDRKEEPTCPVCGESGTHTPDCSLRSRVT